MEKVVEACADLAGKDEKLKLVLIGDQPALHGLLASEIGRRALAQEPAWLIHVDPGSPARVADYYAVLDALIVSGKTLQGYELATRLAAAEAGIYGKQLIVGDKSLTTDLVGKNAGSVNFEAGSTADLAYAIQSSMKRSAPRGSAKSIFSALIDLLPRAPAANTALLASSKTASKKARETHRRDAIARQAFYREGKVTETLEMLESLRSRGRPFDKTERDFESFVAGVERLRNGWSLPPRQPDPGLLTQRRHVLYCLNQSMPHASNGYATRSHGVAVGLQHAGYRVRATTRPGFPWDAGAHGLGTGYYDTEVEGITYVACSGANLNKTPLDRYFAEAADHFLREAQACGAEIIVAASNHIVALPALMAARRLGLPFVYEVRGLWEVTQASIQPEWSDSDRYRIARTLERQAALEADLVVTLTEELAAELAAWGVSHERIQIVPNAVDEKRFKPMAPDASIAEMLDLRPGVPVIGYAGSAVAYEGLELLMEALAQLKQDGQPFHFVLVGDGKAIDTVKAKAGTLGIADECRFAGRVPFEQVPRYLSCMDILPIPRLSSDVTEMVSALKPLEAMAMGKALLLSDVSPHITMAGPERQRARLFAKDNVEALKEGLQSLIDCPDERHRLGQSARKWIEQERTWSDVARRYADALQHTCSESHLVATDTRSTAKSLDRITLGLIGDQFTTDTLAAEVKIVPLSPENWREELAATPIDALFLESAWKGNDGKWFRKVGSYSEEEFALLRGLLTHCRTEGIPSLFWNKEDPVHFERFRKAASLCDHVFTTDSRRIVPYLANPGALTQSASSAPFYASPKIHNLLPSRRDWQATAAYGGTHYGKRYPERTEYMDKIMSAAAPLGLTIYDRQHDDPDSPYKYPSGLGSYVAGGLTYQEMIQAYKAHPVQINVNSVLDSPTMFSRRVVEAAACGSPIISGPAAGMNRCLDDTVHIVHTESEAAKTLEDVMHHPAYRWRTALKAARAVMRAHTAELRLVQMLRTAGMVICAPQPPSCHLVTTEVTTAAANRLLAQTLRPVRVLAKRWQTEAQDKLQAAGIECGSFEEQNAEAGSLWFLADTGALECLEEHDLEDLAWPTCYAKHHRIGFCRDAEPNPNDWPGVAYETDAIAPGLQLVRPIGDHRLKDLSNWASGQVTLAIRKPSSDHELSPVAAPKKTLLIAGHDLKFIKPFYPHFTAAGMRVLLDFWTGHNQHDKAASERLIRQADIVFCEWMLGNAIWYARHQIDGQRLVGRFHQQEINHRLFPEVPFETFDAVIFVGPHVLRRAVAKNPALKDNGCVIHNGVDIDGLQSVPRKTPCGKVLGMVGIVPQMKRFDVALDILRDLRRTDAEYILRIKGRRPEEYGWMANRPDEMAWYESQYHRLENDPLLRGAVFFDPHGDDMPDWYAGVDFVLSTSDFESFHLTVADGSAAGCTPIVLPWEGADEIYPHDWVIDNPRAAVERIMAGPTKKEKIAMFSKENFHNQLISKKISNLLLDV